MQHRANDRFQKICPFIILAGLLLLAGCAPSINNLEPGSGVPGDKVVITGGKLTVGGKNPVAVDFNGTAATFKAVGNDVHATVPTGATTGRVHVKTQYVDSKSPGGIAESPFDFKILANVFSETETNDTRTAANDAGMFHIIKGSISDTDKIDWFKIVSGAPGVWGYGVEVVAEPGTLPAGGSLRVDMHGFRDDIGAIGNLTTYHDAKPFILWTTQAPKTDIYLQVSFVGSTSGSFKADYQLKIGRFKIADSNESDNSFNSAKPIAMINGQGSHAGSYLCNIMQGGKTVGMSDFYSFSGNGATQISVVVVTPSLHTSDKVRVELYDPSKSMGYRGGTSGNYVAANYTLKLTGGEKAFGQWYVEVTNHNGSYNTAGSGPTDTMPWSCKSPYTITIIAQ